MKVRKCDSDDLSVLTAFNKCFKNSVTKRKEKQDYDNSAIS